MVKPSQPNSRLISVVSALAVLILGGFGGMTVTQGQAIAAADKDIEALHATDERLERLMTNRLKSIDDELRAINVYLRNKRKG